MKVPILFIALILIAQNAESQIIYRISGHFSGSYAKQIKLVYYLDTVRVAKTSAIENGKFRFSGDIPGPIKASISFINDKTSERHETSLFIEPKNMTLHINEDNIKGRLLKGSNSQKQEVALEKKLYEVYGKYNDKYEEINRLSKNNKTPKIEKDLLFYDSLRNTGAKQINSVIKKFIIQNPTSPVSAYQLSFYKNFWPTDTIVKYLSYLDESIGDNYYVIDTKTHISKSIRIGSSAKDFTIQDINGNSIQLSEKYKEKYVLLDFWASWCIPCIGEFPALKKLYKEHNDKLEIIGLSIDEESSAWKQSIAEHKIPWISVLVGPAYKNENKGDSYIPNLYIGVSTIPKKYLIDKKGNIVAIFLGSQNNLDDIIKMIQ